MYVIEARDTELGLYLHLHEMKAAEARAAIAASTETHWYRECSAQEAHRHVRLDGIHSTPLWVDENNRIRRA